MGCTIRGRPAGYDQLKARRRMNAAAVQLQTEKKTPSVLSLILILQHRSNHFCSMIPSHTHSSFGHGLRHVVVPKSSMHASCAPPMLVYLHMRMHHSHTSEGYYNHLS